MRKLLVMIMAVFAMESQADDAALLNVVMDKIEFGQWENARAFAAHADDDIVRDYTEWSALRAGLGYFADYQRFLSEKPEWPGLPLMQRYGEATMPEDLPPEDVIAFVEQHGPQSLTGLKAYLRALMISDRIDDAKAAFEAANSSMAIDYETMLELRFLLPTISSDDVFAQFNFLMREGETELARAYLEGFSEDARAVLETRLALAEGAGDFQERFDALDEKAQADPFLTSDRAYAAFRNKDRPLATELMEAASTSAKALGAPADWMRRDMRTRLAGDAVWVGDYQRGYDMAANHFIDPKAEGYALAEWTAGFIALEFLGKRKAALEHFRNFKEAVSTPISNGRAGYWIGRAGDAEGYEYGAKFQTSFYGQLSAEMAGIEPDESLLATSAAELSQETLANPSVHAGLLLAAAGQRLTARRFFQHAAESLDVEQSDALGFTAVKIGIPDAAVGMGKVAARTEAILPYSYYPLPAIYPEDIPAPLALALAITRQESEFYQRAESYVGAKGYMQLMPATAEQMAARAGVPYSESALLDDGTYNVLLGTNYLDEVGEIWNDRVPLIAVSYNAGPHRAKDWIAHVGPMGNSIEQAVFWLEMIRFEETRNYAQRILEGVYIYDAKLNGEFRLKSSDLLLKPYR